MNRSEYEALQRKVVAMLADHGFVLTPEEERQVEIAELGLGEFDKQGMGVVTYVNNENYCAKELVLFPNQTFVEHKHPVTDSFPGKRETFRCRFGTVYLYVEGEPTPNRRAQVPAGSEAYYTVFHEITLHPGDQYTIEPDTWHWFQAGSEGAIVSEFSTTSRDDLDLFTDPRVKRIPELDND